MGRYPIKKLLKQAFWMLTVVVVCLLFAPFGFGYICFLIAGKAGAAIGAVFGLLVGVVGLSTVAWAEQEYGSLFIGQD